MPSSSSSPSYPPLPTLPNESGLARYNSLPPDFMSPIRRFPADEKAQYLVYDAWEAPTLPEKMALLQQALRIFPFSVDALNAWADLYVRCFPGLENYEKAEQTYQLAIRAADWLWPGLKDQDEIEWGHVEHRPFLRAYHGRAVAQSHLGNLAPALETFRFLLRVNPNDNQGVRTLLFDALLQLGKYKEAEEIVEQHSDGRNTTSAEFRWGFVVIDHLKSNLGVCSEKQVAQSLVAALQCNNFVAPLLLKDIPLPPRPQYVSPGSMDEAASIVHSIKRTWKRVAGVLDWLKEQQQSGGVPKPSDDGTLLFELLQKGKILVKLKNGKFLELTSQVDQMHGTLLEEFCLPPGMKDHDPAKIVAYQFHKETDGRHNFSQNFATFSYDDVAMIPFWNVLNKPLNGLGTEESEKSCTVCYEPAHLKCSRCQAVWYCGQVCQKKDWKGKTDRMGPSHKIMCDKFIKT